MPGIIGVGYQGKADEQVIADLRQAGVSVVVDVRANPYSRGRKSLLNRNLAEDVLAEHGIRYVWHGDLLGNPRDASGQRTLSGFKEYMKTPQYEQGLKRLFDTLSQVNGTVALLCYERDDQECHRHHIIEDMKRRAQ